MIKGVWESIRLGPHIHTKGSGLVKGISGWCVVCMGNGVETKSMVAHDKTNGQWERRGLMGHDELKDMGCLMPMRKEA
jgi:hypothetical protein